MWIIPKTLSAFVPATPGWSLESSEQAWMFAQSVTWRSKFMSKQYWLKRWKKGDYVQHLFGATLNPSMHDRFVESWTESQEASHVSHFQAPENEKDKKTQGTYGQASQTLFDFADPDGSSSKTCQDWLPLGCVTSCKTWDKWVIERRGTYSVRKKLALHTKGNECSSLQNYPTPAARDYKGTNSEEHVLHKSKGFKGHMNQLPNFIKYGMQNWATPQASDHIEGARTAKESNQKCLGRDLNQMKWATPNTMDHLPPKTGEALARNKKKGGCKNLREDVNNPKMNGLQDQEKSNTSGKNHGSWPDSKKPRLQGCGEPHTEDGRECEKDGAELSVGDMLTSFRKQRHRKLNPNWVEQDGTSTGWTDLGSWGTELSPKQQN